MVDKNQGNGANAFPLKRQFDLKTSNKYILENNIQKTSCSINMKEAG